MFAHLLVIGFISTGLFSFSPKPDDLIRIWASDSLTKVFHNDRYRRSLDTVEVSGAKSEIVSAQVVLRAKDYVADVSVEITDLKHVGSDYHISRSNITLQWVRYIEIQRNSYLPRKEVAAKAPASIPDPFGDSDAISLEKRKSQPLWIEIEVPQNALAGDYAGLLSVHSEQVQAEIEVHLHVWDFGIPQERHLSVINWWRFPGIGFEEHVRKYSKKYWNLLECFCAFLVKHRQTDINALMKLITHKRIGDIFSYDTTHLEKFSEIAFKAGISRIHLHSAGKRTGSDGVPMLLRKHALGKLQAVEELIKKKNWQGRFWVSICDEPRPRHEESYAKLVDEVHKAAPNIPCVEAILTEYPGDLDVYVVNLGHLSMWYPRFDKRRQIEKKLWFYTCCVPLGRFPNRFLDQPLIKVRVLHWINYLYDLDGYLHWGLNKYGSNDTYSEDGISRNLPLGDRAIVYPGRNGLIGSLRFSAMRDGLEDYEYLWTLENRLKEVKERYASDARWFDTRQRPLELCKRVVWAFDEYTRKPEELYEARRLIAQEIEQLQGAHLLIVQTSPPEGTRFSKDRAEIVVRGFVTKSGQVSINDKNIDIRPNGTFAKVMGINKNLSTVTIKADWGERQLTVQRLFAFGQ